MQGRLIEPAEFLERRLNALLRAPDSEANGEAIDLLAVALVDALAERVSPEDAKKLLAETEEYLRRLTAVQAIRDAIP